jgi:tetratricopeptide (TPR) repeat protein
MSARIRHLLVAACWLWSIAAAPAVESGVTPADGPHPVGFELVQAGDPARAFPSLDGAGSRDRPMRIYIWYPAREAESAPLTVGDFVGMAADDFRLSNRPSSDTGATLPLPVPLAKGLDDGERAALLARPLAARRGAPAAAGEFPLLVMGQGLYYESPLSQACLAEHLASRGYVVATCPLLGTQYRLANLNVEDLETEIRDMEFAIATARARPGVRTGRLGVIGYDLGGMAGLVLTMRNPSVEAFLSLDAGILSPHHSGLPGSLPEYREDRFTVPWMHMTQARFIAPATDTAKTRGLYNRKAYGDSWLVSVPTDSHGQFSSYARFGIRREVPGYWGPVAEDAAAIHDGICRLAGTFFDAVLKGMPGAATALESCVAGTAARPGTVEWKKGLPPPPSSAVLMHHLIEEGVAAARPALEQQRAAVPPGPIPTVDELRWLGYHYLLWWGREAEALDIFQMNVTLHPESADAHAALGEAYAALGRTGEAVAALRKALEIKPDLPQAARLLGSLAKQ